MSETEYDDGKTTSEEGVDPARVLERVRTEPRLYAAGLAVMIVIGLAVSTLHWLGLVVGGALVGIVSATLPRAVGAGLLFGVVVLAVFALSLGGSATAVPAMAPIVYVTVGAAIGLPVLGSLLRGVLP